jgi:O-antigen/teichoic acid export membrane protein
MIAVAPLTTFLIYLARGVGVAGDALLDLQGVRHILGKARWYVLYSSLLAVSGQLDVLMMARYFSYVDVAVYSVASKLFSIFVLGLGAIHSVLLPRMSSMKDPDVLRSILLRSLRFSLPAAGVVLIVTAGWSSELIRFFAGPGYAGASAPLQILGGCAALSLVLSPSVNVLFALERNGVIALGGAIALTVGLVGHLLVTSRYGAYGAAWTTFCAYGAINGFFFAWVLCVTRTEMHPLIHNKE